MTAVASQELCRELHELSGWGMDVAPAADSFWYWVEAHEEYELDDGDVMSESHPPFPAYDLGYLLRKLQPFMHEWELGFSLWKQRWEFNRKRRFGYGRIIGDTPENATAKLAIELFKQGVLTRDTA